MRSLFGDVHRGWPRAVSVLVISAALGFPGAARGHDPSAWGGLFRSRDAGATWLSLNSGSFVSGAIAVAVSPADSNRLLLATESEIGRAHV